MATWHAYAKLRLHTELTLCSFEHVTKDLGRFLRLFARKTAKEFDTRLLPREVAAAARRKAATASKATNNPSSTSTKISTAPHSKVLNLNTYKFHALGDYPATIRMFGTTDSYSTQTVSVFVISESYLF